MNILFLVPQPFYQDRGTPIAVDRILRVLSERGEQVDVITYHEGEDVRYDHVAISRTITLPFVRSIRPGFSWKKLVCDAAMLLKAVRVCFGKRYHLVHAVEESAFIALALKVLYGIPYVYDMDSSLAEQMIEQKPRLAPLARLLDFFEGLAVKNAKAVVPVCDALAAAVEKHHPKKVVVLHDVSLLENGGVAVAEGFRTKLGLTGLVLMYVGNLQAYQGIDLLMEAFALALETTSAADLVIVGGAAADIEKYEDKARRLGIRDRVHFLGPRPVEHLAEYLAQADVLVSPRIKGSNTPMKVYSYLESGKPLLASDLSTHTQVLDNRSALLAKPTPDAFAEGMLRLIEDAELRTRLGHAGKQLVEEKFSNGAFREKVNGLIDWLKKEIDPERDGVSVAVSTREDR